MKKHGLFAFIALCLGVLAPPALTQNAHNAYITLSDSTFHRASPPQKSGSILIGEGIVTRILPDDNEGSRHQRFILKINTGQSLLIAHNIDLAPRLKTIKVGDTVRFKGIYEWNAKGGVIHWTHHDPRGRHPAGWLEHQGQHYQ